MDAFTSEAFQGNPAAVVLLSPTAYHKSRASEWMQRVAMENNLSETAYTAPREHTAKTPEDVAEYDLRWFCPGILRGLLQIKSYANIDSGGTRARS